MRPARSTTAIVIVLLSSAAAAALMTVVTSAEFRPVNCSGVPSPIEPSLQVSGATGGSAQPGGSGFTGCAARRVAMRMTIAANRRISSPQNGIVTANRNVPHQRRRHVRIIAHPEKSDLIREGGGVLPQNDDISPLELNFCDALAPGLTDERSVGRLLIDRKYLSVSRNDSDVSFRDAAVVDDDLRQCRIASDVE